MATLTNQVSIVNEQVVLGKQFKVYGDFENPLFLAKDVAEWIDYAKTGNGFYNVSMMLQSVDDDEKTKMYTTNNLGSGQEAEIDTFSQQSWFLTENGLYELLMLSKKPIAKEFKKEVKKILKGLRTKTLEIKQANNNPITDDTVKTLAESVLKLLADKKELQEQVDKTTKKLESAKPKVDFYDTVIAVDQSVTMTVAANFISTNGFVIGRNNLIAFLKEKEILKGDDSPEKNLPYQKYIDAGYFKVEMVPFTKPPKEENDTEKRVCIGYKSTVTPKGIAYIIELLAKSDYVDKKGRKIKSTKNPKTKKLEFVDVR